MLKILKLFFVLSFFVTFSYASKIVSVGGSITETVVALGHSNELIGVDLSSSYPKEITSKLPNVGYWIDLPQEGILSLKPENGDGKIIEQLKSEANLDDNGKLKNSYVKCQA